MTRKDYILIAEALRIRFYNAGLAIESVDRDFKLDRSFLSGTQNGILAAAEEIADSLARDNARFDREHFLAVVRGEKSLNSRPSRS